MSAILSTTAENIAYRFPAPRAKEDDNGGGGGDDNMGWNHLVDRLEVINVPFEISACTVQPKVRGGLEVVIPVGERITGRSFVRGSGAMIGRNQFPSGRKGTLAPLAVEYEMT